MISASCFARKLLTGMTLGIAACAPNSTGPTRIIELQTEEVTSPDVTVSPDGTTLVFTLLGHLFNLPAKGGLAQQLTFGPFYHHDPTYSPDGRQLAFLSNRDGSEDDVFVMDLETRDITQVTHEPRAGQPSWSPDGRSLLYLSYGGASRRSEEAQVREVELESRAVRVLDASGRDIRSVFYTADGQAGWGVVGEAEEGDTETQVELAANHGSPLATASIPGAAERILPSPDGNGYFARSQQGEAHILRVQPNGETAITDITPVWSWYGAPRFAVSRDAGDLFFGEKGHLWRTSTEGGTAEEVRFHATPRLEVAVPVPIPTISLSTVPERPTISSPRLTPDGRALVFGALGSLWKQRLSGGDAERLVEGDALARDPAISPDGRELAYVRLASGEQELRVRDFESGTERTIHRGAVLHDPAWRSDGERIVVASHDWTRFSVVVIDPTDSTRSHVVIQAGRGFLSPRPHFSLDGLWLHYRMEAADTATIQRVGLAADHGSQTVAKMPNHLGSAVVSPDGHSIVFRRDHELWVARVQGGVTIISTEGARQISPTGGTSFAFTPNGQALVYAAEGRVWMHPLTGRVPREIPIELGIDQEIPQPLLVRRVRALDFSSGTFGPEGSVFVDGGRIRWIGPEDGREIPSGTRVLDAEGRYAIPGLFDVHNHVEGVAGSQAEWIANGITTVRDMGGRVGLMAALAERSLLLSSPIPRYVYSGDFLRGHPSNKPRGSMLVRSEDQVRSGIRRNRDGGASFIKVYFSVPWPLQLAAADEARRWGLPIAAHGQHVHEVVREVILGYRFLEHVDPDGRFYDDVQQLLALSGTYWTPTLSLGGTDQLLTGDLPRAKATGVNVLIGTDAPAKRGTQLHAEMESFVQAGFTPLEVLETCTRTAAEALGVAQDLGSLEAGKLADMVILDADPLENIGNTRTIWRVVKGGWVFDPEELMAGSKR